MKTQHTPTPWTFKRIPIYSPLDPQDGLPVFDCQSYAGSEWLAKAKANSQLIVKAVNCHEELLEACRALSACDANEEDWNKLEWLECVQSAIKLAQAAIAKATGGQS